MERCKRQREESKIKVSIIALSVYHISKILSLQFSQMRFHLESPSVLTEQKMYLRHENSPESPVPEPFLVPGLSRNTRSCECTSYNHFHRVGRSQSCLVTRNHHNYQI